MPPLHLTRTALTAALAAAAALTLLMAVPSVASAGCTGAGAHPTDASLRVIKKATHCLLNQRRANAGLPRLQGDRRLTTAARLHSASMAESNFFSHTGLNGSSSTDRIRNTGYLLGARSWATGENIAWGSYDWATPRSIVKAWMRSSGHRTNILSRSFDEIGIGVVRGAPVAGVQRGATYTTDFGRN